MSKRTLFLIFALFIITSVLLAIALYKPYIAPAPAPIVIKEPIAQTTLSFGNPSITTSSSVFNLNYSLPINIATGKNKVNVAQLELQYDPKILTQVTVVPGTFFKNPLVLLNQIDKTTGRISYAFGINPEDQAVTGQGVVATITFTAKAGIEEQTGILFLPKTLVNAEGVAQSVLKTTNNALFSVGIVPTTITPPISGY